MARQMLRASIPTASRRFEIKALSRLVSSPSIQENGLAFRRCFRKSTPVTPQNTLDNYKALLTHLNNPPNDQWTITWRSFTTCSNARLALLSPAEVHSSSITITNRTSSSSQRLGGDNSNAAAPAIATDASTNSSNPDITSTTTPRLTSLLGPLLKPSIAAAVVITKALTSLVPARLFAVSVGANKGKASVDEIIAKRKSEALEAQKKIEEDLRTSKVVVYATSKCKFSMKAKQALEDVGCKDYKWVDVCQDPDKKPVTLAVLSSLTNSKPKVPKVFINGKYLGGGNECERLRDSGALSKLIKD